MKRILVPTDFSELATAALLRARTIAAKSDAELVVVYADPFRPPPHFTVEGMDRIVEAIERSKAKTAEALIHYANDHLGQSVRWRTEVVENAPVDGILAAMEKEQPDLVVMGTHGRTGWNRFTLGSVTERILHESRVPLLVTRGTAKAAAPAHFLVATDFQPCCQPAFAAALEHARLFGARITLLHVAGESGEPDDAAWRAFLASSPVEGVAIETRTERGDPAERVLEIAEEIGADTIVVGIQHKRFRDTTVLGTNAVRIIRHAPVPVLAVPG